jgi:hypothetical protein
MHQRDSARPGRWTISTARASETIIGRPDVAWQSVSQIMHHPTVQDVEHLYLQIVTAGTMFIEHRGEKMTFRTGDIVLLDPLVANARA